MPARGASLLLALAAGMVLADSSVVTLALPAILREFDAGVAAVAWVLIAFNLALAFAALPAWRLARGRAHAAFVAGSVAFAVASLGCAAAPSLGVLIAARAGQGVVGAVVVAAALELLLRAVPRVRAVGLWAAAGVLGGAVGPALGGVLTEAFSWEAMFALQAPVALVALLGARGWRGARGERGGPGEAPAGERSQPAAADPSAAPLVALALVSAALSAALFLLVVMLIEGWRMSPGEAALVVTAMPLAALVAGRWARARHRLAPALPGSVLLAGGLAALGLLPGTGAAWTIAPQIAVGAGLGLALGALVGTVVDGGPGGEPGRAAARTVAARHAGIVAGLLVLTPIFTADLDAGLVPAQRAGLARVLDAPIAIGPKLAIARALDGELRHASDQQLPDLGAAFARAEVPAGERADADRLRAALDDELDRAATSAFARSFVAAALLALLSAGAVAAAIALGLRGRPRVPAVLAGADGTRLERLPSLNVALPGACALATLLVAVYVSLGGSSYGPTAAADPCAPRARPAVERSQRATLAALDGAACTLRSSREELLLALLERRLPPGVSDDELTAAVGDGIDRAERERQLGRFEAIGLRLALRVGGALGIAGRLLPE